MFLNKYVYIYISFNFIQIVILSIYGRFEL